MTPKYLILWPKTPHFVKKSSLPKESVFDLNFYLYSRSNFSFEKNNPFKDMGDT